MYINKKKKKTDISISVYEFQAFIVYEDIAKNTKMIKSNPK